LSRRRSIYEFGDSEIGYVPVVYKEKTYFVPLSEEHLRKLFLPYMYSMLMSICNDLVPKMISEKVSILESRMTTRHNIIGISLCTFISAVSVILSILSFISFNMVGLAQLFLYGAVASVGGMIFIGYKQKKES